jgi:hypothetical protein
VQARDRIPIPGERLEQRDPTLDVLAERGDCEHGLAPVLLRKGRMPLNVRELERERDLVGSARDHVACVAEHPDGLVEPVDGRPAEDELTDLVQPVLDGCRS